MILVPIAPADLDAAWPVVEPFAAQMQQRFPDDWPTGETYRRAASGQMVLWLVWDEAERAAYGLLGTEVLETVTGKRLLTAMIAAGREAQRWWHVAEERLTAHARDNDCTMLRVDGRAGWARLMPGWKAERLVAMTKELD